MTIGVCRGISYDPYSAPRFNELKGHSMDDVFRKRLSEEELAEYDKYDRRASFAGHFFVWPGIAGLISYTYGRYPSAAICFALVALALPIMIWMGGRARKLRELAEKRYLGIMDPDANSEAERENEPAARTETGSAKKIETEN